MGVIKDMDLIKDMGLIKDMDLIQSQWTQLQFGLFSVPTSGPQLGFIKGRGTVLFKVYGKVPIKDPLLLNRKDIAYVSKAAGFLLKTVCST